MRLSSILQNATATIIVDRNFFALAQRILRRPAILALPSGNLIGIGIMRSILLILDLRREAIDVRRVLREPSLMTLKQVRDRLASKPHDYPDGLLRVLISEMPKIKLRIQDRAAVSIVDDIFRTAEWEAHARDIQLIM